MIETEHPARLSLPPRGAWIAFAVALFALSTSLAIRGAVSVWASTATAGVIGVVAAIAGARGELRTRLPSPPRYVVAGLVAGVAMAVATHVLYPVGVALVPGLESHVAALYDELHAPPGRRAAVPLLLLVVLAEELVFRGLLVALLERWGMKRAAVLVIATAFYVVPQVAGGSLVLVGLALACGALWTWQRLVSGTIALPLLTHAIWDLLVFVIVPLPPGR